MIQNNTETVDILVIGAGPSGTVAASILKNNGFNVKIIEKQTFPRFVIGESLLPRCMENLEYAGLLHAVEQGGFQKKYGAKFVKDDIIADFDFSDQFTDGWTWTWQVQRATFDHLLAKETEKKGVPIDYASEVTDVIIHEDKTSTTTVKKEDGTTFQIKAKFIVDASGYGGVLPRLMDLHEPSSFSERSAFFCHMQDELRPQGTDGNRITIIAYSQEGWIWVIPFSDGTSFVGILGMPELVNIFEGTPDEQYSQWLANVPELKDRFKNSERKFEPRKIIGYAASVKKLYGDGFVLTGNSTEFLDPVFSSGVTLATESGAMAAKLITKELNGEEVNWEEEYSNYIKDGVDVFRTFVSTWYDGSLQKIIFTQESNTELKKQICSVLAGYVWDKKNPFVAKHARAVKALSNVLN